MSQAERLPEYSVRPSKRARRVTIKVSSHAGVEVVVPVRFRRSDIPGLVHSKLDWIVRTLEKVGPVKELKRPDNIQLRLLNQSWRVSYRQSSDGKLRVTEKDPGELLVSGPSSAPQEVAAGLNQWLQKRAKETLVPWLNNLSSELGLPFTRVGVRRQRTKWGSCSAEKSISLNRNLLFLPEDMARYVLVHELCHVRQLNHSDRFWRLLETFEPNARATAVRVRKESSSVPLWAMV
ncbi:MAG: M48 family metallopeptidase [SAR202 cluster bacterium]|nr:metal-dependent hydrolase [Chloroflexota bacterium]MQG34175.1 M48 family metallopeptidase [SAR202 cluster bacterium]HCP23474.1 M48 family peptidase [Dehalococcoidia bacterium]|tara:strand:- start:2064 stop:2768 length:705 start_codon:yes stop_codon:yes gene_type:complete